MNVERLNFEAIEVQAALADGRTLAAGQHQDGLKFELLQWRQDLFVLFRRDQAGGIALRTPIFDECSQVEVTTDQDQALLCWSVSNAVGKLTGRLDGENTGLAHFSYVVTLTPHRDVHIPYFPRDLIPFGEDGDPLASEGSIEAVQRRLNTALCFFNLTKPAMGAVLYVQNLTALNDYFRATATIPEDAVGGSWPILGYLAPTDPSDTKHVLKGGTKVTLYDTRLVVRSTTMTDESDCAWQFLDMLGAFYRGLEKPSTVQRDWPGRARKTLRDLSTSPKVRVRHYGQTYFHPYTCAEYPDSMVQLSLLSAVHDWSLWCGKQHPVADEIRRGLSRFYDPELQTMCRYLLNVGDDKNANAVDSWYIYHTLLNLSNLALGGDELARDLFLKSIDSAIRAGRHFKYMWPIQYDVRDFSILTAVAPADHRGQTDVGGIYAWVMLQAFELTSDARFLKEAKKSLEAARGMRFNLNYQANLTAWGAAASIRMWRITNEKTYLALSYVYLASFFHNAQMWESEIGHAQQYSNFLAVTCLQDAPYMALYECFDSFAAFERYLEFGGPDLIPSAKHLVSEYCRYALHRAWYFYPDALPKGAIATKQRNGEIDRRLSFPVEDLYPDGQPAGQVGQEVYGAGGALIFAARSFHRVEGAPFQMFCDHFVRALIRQDSHTLSLRIDGEQSHTAQFHIIATARRGLKKLVVRTLSGDVIEPSERTARNYRYEVPACAGLVITWL